MLKFVQRYYFFAKYANKKYFLAGKCIIIAP